MVNENYYFTAYITINGERLYAKDYGHKAWRIPKDRNNKRKRK